uniref:2-aminoethanethiol dioxygenase isoform X2 n=1 Tax=Rhizophora mucronata TaxID=61149 RepID=A0A2P2JMT6_RHIMU
MKKTKIFSNIQAAAGKVRKTPVVGHKNKHSLFSVCFKSHLNDMVEQSSFSASSAKVQSLFGLCKSTFTPSGISPLSPKSEKKICSLLGMP